MKWCRILVGLFAVALVSSGCSSKKPLYEGVARICFSTSAVDLKWELAFLRAEAFLSEVFGRLDEDELSNLSGEEPRHFTERSRYLLFRQFVNHASARQAGKSKAIEVCFEHGDARCAATIANKIAELYLSVKGDDAYLLERALPRHASKR